MTSSGYAGVSRVSRQEEGQELWDMDVQHLAKSASMFYLLC